MTVLQKYIKHLSYAFCKGTDFRVESLADNTSTTTTKSLITVNVNWNSDHVKSKKKISMRKEISCYVFSLCVVKNERITENILIMLLNGEKW